MNKKWVVIPHTADYAVQVHGRDFPELASNCITALKESMYQLTDISRSSLSRKSLKIHSLDQNSLLIDLLREIHYLIISEKIIPISCNFSDWSEKNLKIYCFFRKIEAADVKIREIKAVTYHDAIILKEPRGLSIRIVCDV
ncbi:MAG: archease [Candidatus Cloacimonetes bacterium]|nr:archease [Candidatus Cloacimonadota bacterium]